MKVVIASATEKEIIPLREAIAVLKPQGYETLQITFIETGVGMLSSCFSLAGLFCQEKPDLVIQAGIAGTFSTDIILGSVVVVKDEFLADMGVEEGGIFRDLFDLNLQQDFFPYTNRSLSNVHIPTLNYLCWKEVTGITINEITTSERRINQLKRKYNPVIETMEGASFHYCCICNQVPFLQVRAVSNYIGERDKSKWNFKDSFNNLASSVAAYLDYLDTKQTG